MFDEDKYPTMKYKRCRKCGNVFAMSLTGATECPDCSSGETEDFHPDLLTKKTAPPKSRKV